jgi:hypothetical protein
MLSQLKNMHEKVKADGIAVKQPTGSQSINGPAKSTAVDVATT